MEHGRRTHGLARLVVVLAIACMASLFAAWSGAAAPNDKHESSPELVVVPDIIGLTEIDAIWALDGVGLIVGEHDKVPDASTPEDSIVSQHPSPDTRLEAGSAVDYVVSIGPAPVVVPDIVEMVEAEALDALDNVGLVAGERTEAHDDWFAQDVVLASDPAADIKVAPGTAVDYLVSTGPPPVVVPDIVDLSEADALQTIDDAGLAARWMTEAFDDAIVAGDIIASDPAAHTEVSPGSEVAYVLSIGPSLVAVPDIVDLGEADALDLLDEAGFAAGDMTEASDGTIVAGNVISSDPAAYAEVAPGSEVAYVISTGPGALKRAAHTSDDPPDKTHHLASGRYRLQWNNPDCDRFDVLISQIDGGFEFAKRSKSSFASATIRDLPEGVYAVEQLDPSCSEWTIRLDWMTG